MSAISRESFDKSLNMRLLPRKFRLINPDTKECFIIQDYVSIDNELSPYVVYKAIDASTNHNCIIKEYNPMYYKVMRETETGRILTITASDGPHMRPKETCKEPCILDDLYDYAKCKILGEYMAYAMEEYSDFNCISEFKANNTHYVVFDVKKFKQITEDELSELGLGSVLRFFVCLFDLVCDYNRDGFFNIPISLKELWWRKDQLDLIVIDSNGDIKEMIQDEHDPIDQLKFLNQELFKTSKQILRLMYSILFGESFVQKKPHKYRLSFRKMRKHHRKALTKVSKIWFTQLFKHLYENESLGDAEDIGVEVLRLLRYTQQVEEK